jgi:hypothetical protein
LTRSALASTGDSAIMKYIEVFGAHLRIRCAPCLLLTGYIHVLTLASSIFVRAMQLKQLHRERCVDLGFGNPASTEVVHGMDD